MEEMNIDYGPGFIRPWEIPCKRVSLHCKPSTPGLSRWEARLFEQTQTPQYDNPDSSTVLCNLTKHKYIRRDVVQAACKGFDVRLGHVLISKICWSDRRWSYPDGIGRGSWPGCRFIITTLDQLPALGAGDEWKDVSVKSAERTRRGWLILSVDGEAR